MANEAKNIDVVPAAKPTEANMAKQNKNKKKYNSWKDQKIFSLSLMNQY